MKRRVGAKTSPQVDRREFLKITAIGGASLALGVSVGRAQETRHPWKPNAWLRIDPDGTVVVTVGKSEMGQGVRTALPMMVAEELDADWSRIRIDQASPGKDYTRLGTGGSFSLQSLWMPLRRAGATAREMLLLAAANRWNVDRAALRTDRGLVFHDASHRSATYGELTGEAANVAVPQNVPLKAASDFRIVGRRTPRLDGPDIVTGRARYGADIRIPGMKYATVLRSPAPGDKVAGFDAKGVNAVQISSGVAVIADSTWAAMKARKNVQVRWDAGPNRNFQSAAYLAALEKAAASGPATVTRSEGDAGAALAAAGRTFEATYIYPFYAHAAVETVNCTVHVHDGIAEIWSPTQTPNDVHAHAARILGLDPENVKVHVTLIGGGFGRRLRPDYAIEAAEVARAMGGGAVQVLWTREDDMRDGLLQHASVHALRAGVDANGTLAAWTHRKASNRNMTEFGSPRAIPDLAVHYREGSWGLYDIPYAIANLETSYAQLDSPVRYGPWRAVFSPSSTFARESFLDEIAHALRKDPLQFRLDLLGGAETVKAGDLTIERPRLRRVLQTVRDKSGWGSKLPEGRGRGVACNVYDGDTHIAYVAEVTRTGRAFKVDRVVCAVDCGLAINPTGIEQQIEGGIAWALSQLKSEITIKDGRVQQASYNDFDVTRMSDTPSIEIHILPSDKQEPFGMGEPPVPPLVPAVLNAFFAAGGERVRRLPLAR